MGRYSDVKRGPELAAALTAYTTYLGLSQAQKKAAYASLQVNRVVATRIKKLVRVFGATGLLVPLLTPQESPAPDTTASTSEQKEADIPLVTVVRTTLGTHIEATAAGTDFTVPIPKFKPATLFITRVGTNAPVPTTSRFTGRQYNRRQTNTISCPFGKATEAETEETAIGAIIGSGALSAFLDLSPGNSYRITKQATIIANA